MTVLLGYAEVVDNSPSNILFIVVGSGVILAAAVLSVVVIALARRRNSGWFELIATLTFFWAVVVAWSAISAILAAQNWQTEQNLRLESGYYSPAQISADAPKLPWILWGVLAVVYLGLLVWAMRRRKSVAG